MAYTKLNLYDENGYFDFEAVRSLGLPFNFIIGGRGTGKTYGALHSVKEAGDCFMFTRRKANQVDVISNDSGNSKSRNPRMQTMLRMVGFGDNAGSGFPAILNAWETVKEIIATMPKGGRNE